MSDNNQNSQPTFLLCIDLEAGSEELAGYAAEKARRCGTTIRVLHVESKRADEESNKDAREHLQELVGRMLGDIGADEVFTERGIPEEVIASRAEEWNVELIILGRRRRQRVVKIYVGSTTSAVISLAPCPILVVPLTCTK